MDDRLANTGAPQPRWQSNDDLHGSVYSQPDNPIFPPYPPARAHYDSPTGSTGSAGRVRWSPPVLQNSSETTLINNNADYDDAKSGYYASTLMPDDSASNLIPRHGGLDEKSYNNPFYATQQNNNSVNFLAVPNAPGLRSRQGSLADSVYGPGGFGGGFNPNARFSSAMSVISSSDQENTSDAWARRQKIKRGRAKTKKVKLTKGRFITEYGQWSVDSHAWETNV